jgi:regulator of cell morphogenesis and NO signaling
VEAVHSEVTSVPAGLADLLQHVGDELESHMQKEEQILFPMMRAGGHPMICHPIAVMLSEHDDHGENLRRLEARPTILHRPRKPTRHGGLSMPARAS